MKNLIQRNSDTFICYTNLKTPIAKYKNLQIKVEYYIGGINYFSGNHNPRGYRLSFTPCNYNPGGFTESTLMSSNRKESGYYLLIEKTMRFNRKRLSLFAETLDPFVNELTNAYLNDNTDKIREIILKCNPRVEEEVLV